MRNVFKKLILMGVAVTLAGIAEAKTFRYATTGDVLASILMLTTRVPPIR